QPVVKIEHDFVERQFVSQHYARRRKIFKVFLRAALVLTKLQNSADGLIVGNDHRFDDWFLDFFDVAWRRKFCGAVHFDFFAANARDSVTDAWRRRDEVESKFTFEPLLHDFHVQKAKKAAAKSEPERNGIFRLVAE